MSATTYVQVSNGYTTGSSNTGSTSITPSTGTDDLIMIIVTQGPGAALQGLPTSTAGGTVLTDVAFSVDTTNNTGFGVYRVHAAGTVTQHILATFTAAVECYTWLVEAANVGSFDQATAIVDGTTAALQTGTLTPSQDGALVLAVMGMSAARTLSAWSNSFTSLASRTAGPTMAMAYLDQTTHAAVNAGTTLSSAANWSSILVSYIPGVSTAPTVTSVNGGASIAEGATGVSIVGTGFTAGMTAAITQPNGCVVSQPVTYVSSTSATFNLVMEPGSGDQLCFTDATYVTSFSATVGGQSSTALAVTLVPAAGDEFVTVGTPNSNSAYRITASPDIVTGNQLEASGSSNGATAAPTGLTINSDATWDFTAGNTPANFYVRAYDQSTFTWGAWALQSVIAVTTRSQWMPFQMACRLRVLQQGILDVGNTRQNIANLLSLATTEANGAAGWAKWRTVLNTAKVPGNLRINVPQVPGYTAPP